MRISSALYFQTGLNSINKQQSDLVHTFQQLGSGKRMITAADDPLAAAQTITLGQSQSMNLRFAENRHVALRNLGEEENVLMSLVPQVREVKVRLIEASNDTYSYADRASVADVLKEMKESIHGLMNGRDASGQYLFSGSKGNDSPYGYDKNQHVGKRYFFKGDTHSRLVQADQTRQIDSADHGKHLFGEKDSANILNVMDKVIVALQDKNLSSEDLHDDLDEAMRWVDKTYHNILTVRASVGARMNKIEAIDSSGKLQGLHLASEISRLEDLDYYSASTQLELRTSALEAAALAFKKIQSTNLFAINARG